MLKETSTRRRPDEPLRRLFSDEIFDLFLWHEPDGGIRGFQLLYRLPGYPFLSVMWTPKNGWHHHSMVSGERGSEGHDVGTGMAFMEPANFDKARVTAAFATAAVALEPAIRDFVADALARHPETMIACALCNERRAATASCCLCDAKACSECVAGLRYAECPRTRPKPNGGWFPSEKIHSWFDHY